MSLGSRKSVCRGCRLSSAKPKLLLKLLLLFNSIQHFIQRAVFLLRFYVCGILKIQKLLLMQFCRWQRLPSKDFKLLYCRSCLALLLKQKGFIKLEKVTFEMNKCLRDRKIDILILKLPLFKKLIFSLPLFDLSSSFQ